MRQPQVRPREHPALGQVRSFVAIGDSFTAGTGTPAGTCWADRLAGSLRRECPELLYANFGREGATSDQILEQAWRAIELEPDLATVIGGANDILESVRPEPRSAIARLAEAFDAIRAAVPGSLVVTATLPCNWDFVPMGPRTRARVSTGLAELNKGIRTLAAKRGMPCLDVAAHPGLADPENFCEDGLHPSDLGHAKAVAAFERLLQSHTGSNGWVTER